MWQLFLLSVEDRPQAAISCQPSHNERHELLGCSGKDTPWIKQIRSTVYAAQTACCSGRNNQISCRSPCPPQLCGHVQLRVMNYCSPGAACPELCPPCGPCSSPGPVGASAATVTLPCEACDGCAVNCPLPTASLSTLGCYVVSTASSSKDEVASAAVPGIGVADPLSPDGCWLPASSAVVAALLLLPSARALRSGCERAPMQVSQAYPAVCRSVHAPTATN